MRTSERKYNKVNEILLHFCQVNKISRSKFFIFSNFQVSLKIFTLSSILHILLNKIIAPAL